MSEFNLYTREDLTKLCLHNPMAQRLQECWVHGMFPSYEAFLTHLAVCMGEMVERLGNEALNAQMLDPGPIWVPAMDTPPVATPPKPTVVTFIARNISRAQQAAAEYIAQRGSDPSDPYTTHTWNYVWARKMIERSRHRGAVCLCGDIELADYDSMKKMLNARNIPIIEEPVHG